MLSESIPVIVPKKLKKYEYYKYKGTGGQNAQKTEEEKKGDKPAEEEKKKEEEKKVDPAPLVQPPSNPAGPEGANADKP